MRKVEPTAQHACRKTTFEHKAGPQLPHAAGVTTGQPPPRTMALPAGWPNLDSSHLGSRRRRYRRRSDGCGATTGPPSEVRRPRPRAIIGSSHIVPADRRRNDAPQGGSEAVLSVEDLMWQLAVPANPSEHFDWNV